MNEGKFDAYAYVGVIAPGTVLAFGGLSVFPDLSPFSSKATFTVGDFGLFLLIAFVLGHLVQSVGNVVENLWWFPFGGMPTNWVLEKPDRLLAASQVENLNAKLATDFGIENGLLSLSKHNWIPITRQVYAKVNAAGRSGRADTFNQIYGLTRGVSASFFALAIVVLAVDVNDWKTALILTILGMVALTRMHRFGKHYAREVFVQYLDL